MFGDEPYGNYNRILLSGVLAGTHDPKDIFINPLAWYDQMNVRLHAGARASRIDRAAQQVFGDDGAVADYDLLVIATGSSAFIPPIAGLRDDTRRAIATACSCSARSTTATRFAITPPERTAPR